MMGCFLTHGQGNIGKKTWLGFINPDAGLLPNRTYGFLRDICLKIHTTTYYLLSIKALNIRSKWGPKIFVTYFHAPLVRSQISIKG